MRLSRRPQGERGSVSVIFALMAATLLGVGALVVDVGAMYVEGRQLQNGAESAARAIAQTCATSAGCSTSAGNALADQNAEDGETSVEDVCGTALGTSCPSGASDRSRFGCRPSSTTAPYVQVHTQSRRDGVNTFSGLFIKLLNPDYDDAPVRACARAAYGAPGGLVSELPLTLSSCEWTYWTNQYQSLFGTKYVTGPPYPANSEAVLYFHNTGDLGPSDCPRTVSNSGAQTAGGFGWLQTTDGQCEVATDSAGDAYEKPGNSVPSDCNAGDFSALLDQVVHVPVFSEINTSTNTYDITGYAAFQLTGYRLSGSPAFTKPSPTLEMPCTPSTRCIIGRFVEDPAPAAGPLVAGPGYGVTAIAVTG